jgi:L-ribulokinase
VVSGQVAAIGVDATGSTPVPVDGNGVPLGLNPEFGSDPAALAWLWKDHTSTAEAEEITASAADTRPHFLVKCGGRYSSEWFWSKILHCRRVAPRVFEAAHSWVELADLIPGILTGTSAPERLMRGICAAGHKGMFHSSWGGYPDAEFLGNLDEGLARVRSTLPAKAFSAAHVAGTLTPEWASCLGLRAEIPVAVGAIDAHMGAVGSGIEPGSLVKIMGTSTCDMAVAPLEQAIPDIPGLCGIVPESILPGFHGFEAGQSAVGDIFNWFTSTIQPGGAEKGTHEELARGAAALRPGESGLLALDWQNGNRTVLVDQRLTGLLVGMTLRTTPAEIYRALIEATAFGARVIIDRLVEYEVPIRRVIVCGGIAAKNPLVMQIYADVLGMPIEVSRSGQSCALGAAIAASVAAGVHGDFLAATHHMTSVREEKFVPDPASVRPYGAIFALYRQIHDIFGTRDCTVNQHNVMKELLRIRNTVRAV